MKDSEKLLKVQRLLKQETWQILLSLMSQVEISAVRTEIQSVQTQYTIMPTSKVQ